MLTSFSTAVSAMNAQQTAIDVVGNNLANLNTAGYKNVSVDFVDLMSESLNGGSTQVGTGVGNAITRRDFSQGSTQNDTGLLTAALQGPGFFGVQDATGNTLYTRDGSFTINDQGYLTTQTGEEVLGYPATNGVVTASGSPQPIVMPTGTTLPAQATTSVNAVFNLSSGSATGDTYSVPMNVVDSLGATHQLTVTYKKTGPNAWSYTASVDDAGATVSGSGTLNFSTSGTLNATGTPPAYPTGDIKITGLASGAADMDITLKFADSTNTPTVTQTADISSVGSTSQDGYTSSTLTQVSIEDGGKVIGQYADGRTQTLAQLAVYSVRNPDSMTAVGNNEFAADSNTAPPVAGLAGTSGRGDIKGDALEGSTVDIATQFTNLMVFQRGYEASSKVITTADQITQDTINLIR